MNWWDLFAWGYATDVTEYDEEDYREDITIDIEITIEE